MAHLQITEVLYTENYSILFLISTKRYFINAEITSSSDDITVVINMKGTNSFHLDEIIIYPTPLPANDAPSCPNIPNIPPAKPDDDDGTTSRTAIPIKAYQYDMLKRSKFKIRCAKQNIYLRSTASKRSYK